MPQHSFKCKCGSSQPYDRAESHTPHPSEEESQIVKKFYVQANNNGFYKCVGVEVAGATGGCFCEKCAKHHSQKRKEAREKRIEFETGKKLVKPASKEEEEIYAKRGGKRL